MAQPITVFIIFGNLGIGGVQKKIIDISRMSSAKGAPPVQIHIVLRDKSEFCFSAWLNSKNTYIHYRPMWSIKGMHLPFSLYIFWKVIQLHPSVILTFYETLSMFSIIISNILFWRNIKVVINEDILTSAHVSSKIKELMVRIFYPLASCIIVPTIATKNDLIHVFNIPESITRVIPNWTLMKQPRVPQQKNYDIVYIGRFEKQKNLQFLLSCIKTLVSRNKNFQACLVGEGSEKRLIFDYINTRNLQKNIHVFSSTLDVQQYLKYSRIFALCSTYEGMSVAALEAMASGTPIIATHHPGADEYIVHNTTGILVKNEAEFISSVELLLSDKVLCAHLKTCGLKAIHKQHSKSAVVRYINELMPNNG